MSSLPSWETGSLCPGRRCSSSVRCNKILRWGNSLKVITEPFVIASNFAIQLVITVSLLRPSISGRVLILWNENFEENHIKFVSGTIFWKFSKEIVLGFKEKKMRESCRLAPLYWSPPFQFDVWKSPWCRGSSAPRPHTRLSPAQTWEISQQSLWLRSGMPRRWVSVSRLSGSSKNWDRILI